MIVKAKGVNVGMSTIYYWIHQGKTVKKQASPNFKPAGKSIEQRPKAINLRLENGHYEIDTVLLTRAKKHCLLVLTDRRSRHQIIRLIPNKSAESVNQALKLILKQHQILSITADNELNSTACLMYSLRSISTMHTSMPLGKGELMRITIGSFVDGYLKEPRKRLLKKSSSLKIGLITILKNAWTTSLPEKTACWLT